VRKIDLPEDSVALVCHQAPVPPMTREELLWVCHPFVALVRVLWM
jgi:hypothetical protein